MPDADRSISHKRDELRREGSLNPHPDAVLDPLFHGDPFFDPDDLVQVKYEMLRAEVRDGVSVTDAAARFGLSRVTFYQVRRSFDEAGLAGLFPKKRGPRGGHKLTPEVIAFLFQRLRAAPTLYPRTLFPAHAVTSNAVGTRVTRSGRSVPVDP